MLLVWIALNFTRNGKKNKIMTKSELTCIERAIKVCLLHFAFIFLFATSVVVVVVEASLHSTTASQSL